MIGKSLSETIEVLGKEWRCKGQVGRSRCGLQKQPVPCHKERLWESRVGFLAATGSNLSHGKNPGNTKYVLGGHWFMEIDGNCKKTGGKRWDFPKLAIPFQGYVIVFL